MAVWKKKDRSSLFLDIIVFLAWSAVTALIVSFATPYWYRANPEIISAFLPGITPDTGVYADTLGLWMYCYRRADFRPDRYWDYSVACRSYYTSFAVRVNLPGWFVAVQVLYTIGLGAACIIILLLAAIACCCGRNRVWIAIGAALLTLAAISISIALIVFDSSTNDMRRGDRVGLFGSISQYADWSFWLAVAGLSLLWISALALFVEIYLIRRRKEMEEYVPDQVYTDYLLEHGL